MRGKQVLLAFILVGCSDGGPGNGVCMSGETWTGGNEESPLMRPGGDCVGCHESTGEGPRYEAAGTVFTALDEVDDCNGEPQIEVEITDSEGTVWTTTTNAAGNFWFNTDMNPVYPITALVRNGAAERPMLTPQESGNCAVCHTTEGANGAAGRIIAP